MAKSAENNNLSLFDMYEPQKMSNVKIDVVKMSYIHSESLTWQDLFSGYDEMYAITYSSGVNFVFNLTDMFEKVEVVFGNEAVLSYSMQEIMAYQNLLLKKMRDCLGERKQKILNRIDEGSVRFYVARKKMSHEKIYLLKANDGRKRVIMGSANMSYNAFSGIQRENICYLDDDEAFDWYMDCFEELKNDSTDSISKKAFVNADLAENIDELPIAESVKVNKLVVIEPTKDVSEDVRFVLDVQNMAKQLAPIVPKPDKKNNKVRIVSDTITKIRKHRTDDIVREKELRNEQPQLNIDVTTATVTLNGQKVDLVPSKSEIKNDVDLFLKYMDGYSKFHGDYVEMQYRYYEFANWFFCSPFMATMRDMAARFDRNKFSYPVFGLIYGQSKAGKTSFLETLLKMMIGQKPKMAAPEFTRSSIENLKRVVQGAPIIVDDLTQTRFSSHAIETIKNDDFGVSEHMTNYSAVVISANEDVKAVAPEIVRRTVICRVSAGLTNTEVMRSNVVRSVQQKIGTAFYREYLRRMLNSVPDLIEQMKDDLVESAPDILNLSSKIIIEIIRDHCEYIPEYIRELSLENYFSEYVTGKHAINTIRNAWRTNPKSFEVNTKMNELRYNALQTYEADRLMKELPETLEARKAREWVVMNLFEAKKYFGIEFKKSLLPWKR